MVRPDSGPHWLGRTTSPKPQGTTCGALCLGAGDDVMEFHIFKCVEHFLIQANSEALLWGRIVENGDI